MNTDTGRIYEGAEIEAAQARGEKVVPVSPKVARMMRRAENEMNRRMANLRRCHPNKSEDELREIADKLV